MLKVIKLLLRAIFVWPIKLFTMLIALLFSGLALLAAAPFIIAGLIALLWMSAHGFVFLYLIFVVVMHSLGY